MTHIITHIDIFSKLALVCFFLPGFQLNRNVIFFFLFLLIFIYSFIFTIASSHLHMVILISKEFIHLLTFSLSLSFQSPLRGI